MGIHIAPATVEDVETLLVELRSVDRDEIRALGQNNIRTAVITTVNASYDRCAAVTDDDGGLICIFGFAPTAVIGGIGAPWLLATDRMEGHARELIRRSKPIVRNMLSEYDEMENYVWARNEASIKYLKAVGFEMSDPLTHTITGEPYIIFSMTAKGE